MYGPNNLVITIYLLIGCLGDDELVVDNLVSALLIRWSLQGLVVIRYQGVRKWMG